jgi:exodeoxyribonuclease VII large subunit
VERRLADASQRLEGVGRLLGSLGYQAVLSRGYAVVRNADDAPVMASAGLQKGEALSVEFADGRTHVQVMDDAVGSRKKTPPKRSARKAKPKTSKPDQGDLF